MASKIAHIQPMKVEDHSETDSWGKLKKRFEVAVFSVDIGKHVTEENEGGKKESGRRCYNIMEMNNNNGSFLNLLYSSNEIYVLYFLRWKNILFLTFHYVISITAIFN